MPSYESAIAAYSIIDACNILQLTLLDYEFYATEHESEPDVMALEHVSIQAHLGHTKAKAAARPNIILPQEALTHINRLNQEYSNSNKQFNAVVLCAKDHEGTLQSEQTVMDKFLLAAKSIKKGEMPRTQFIIYISKNSHAWTVDVSWNHHKNRLEIMSFDMTTHSNQEEFLSHFNAKLAAIKCQAVFAICVAKLQKDFDSCMLYAIKFAQISASLTYSKCYEIKDPALTRGNKLYFEVHYLGEKVIRMGQSKAQMRENLLKHYPDDSQKANGAVQKYDVTKHLESLRRKTREWRAAQDAQQPMAELEEKMQVLAIDEPNDTHVEEAQPSLDLLDLIDRLEQAKIDLTQPKQAEFATLLEMLNEWQIRAKAGSGKFP
ncbi:MAG: hypothetical protein AB7V32_03685, partial [Candidatus Berkiella sp.]